MVWHAGKSTIRDMLQWRRRRGLSVRLGDIPLRQLMARSRLGRRQKTGCRNPLSKIHTNTSDLHPWRSRASGADSRGTVQLRDKWVTEYEVMIQKNGYRYYLEYAVPDGWKKVLESIEIDYDVAQNFGRIGDEGYPTDKPRWTRNVPLSYRYSKILGAAK